MRDIDDILCYILLDDKPRTATQPHAFALADGVKPVTFMLADELARLQFYHVTLLFSEITSQVVVVVNLPQETDAL